ncbi:MAG: GTP 3',8-cyclase MoaA [Nitrospinota bacterium]|nr:GTP 3',8-cyclase MoaA [Nitrospinota bacterium]
MTHEIVDGHGRIVDYLRVSVTDRCNLKCDYCMPPSGSDPSPKCSILSIKQLLRLVRIFAQLGVSKFRFTGGEPLLRKGIVNLIRQVSQTRGVREIALTTNGILLEAMASPLREAGVGVVNISLDSMLQERYQAITGSAGLERALAGIDAALEASFRAVKINMVVMRGVNDSEIEDFVQLAIERKIQVRFIEYMPATPSAWRRERLYPMDMVMERAGRVARMEPVERARWGGPAKIYRLLEGKGELGFISPVTRHFCDACNRVRLTAEGEMLTCLFSNDRLDLKSMLLSEATDGQIRQAIGEYARFKPAVRDMEGFSTRGQGAMYKVGG